MAVRATSTQEPHTHTTAGKTTDAGASSTIEQRFWEVRGGYTDALRARIRARVGFVTESSRSGFANVCLKNVLLSRKVKT